MKRKYLLNKLLLVVITAFIAGGLPAAADDEPTGPQIESGWYYLTTTAQAGNYVAGNALTVQNGYMTMENLETTNPAFIFYLKKAEGTGDNNYYLYNLGDDSWYQGAAFLNTGVNVSYLGNSNYSQIFPGFYFEKDSTQRRYFTFSRYSTTFAYSMYPQVQDNLTHVYQHIYNKTDEDYSQNFVITCSGTPSTFVGTQYIKFRGITLLPPTNARLHITFQEVSDNDLQTARMKVALRKAGTMLNDNALYTVGTENLISSSEQLFSNTNNTGSYGNLSYLVDNNTSTTYGSLLGSVANTAGTAIHFTPSFVQVDLTNNKQVQGVQLTMNVGWAGPIKNAALFPTDITIFGTNDAATAEDEDLTEFSMACGEDAWTKIGDFNFTPYLKYTNDYYGGDVRPTVVNTDITQKDSQSRNIIFPDGQKYRYLRIYVNNTTVNYNSNHMFQISELGLKELTDITASTGQQSSFQTLRNLVAAGNAKIKSIDGAAAGVEVTSEEISALEAAMQAVEESANPARVELQAVLDSLDGAAISFSIGTIPGMHIDSLVANYNQALAAARVGLNTNLSDAEYAQLINNVLTALEKAKQTIPVTDGYYSIVNCYRNFYHTKAMIGLPTKNIIGWEDYSDSNPAEVFKITKTGEGQYSIQNIVTGKYFGTIAGVSQEPTVTDTIETPQTITAIEGYPGQFNIANTENPVAYHAEFHRSGLGPKGYVCTYNGGGYTCSSWRLLPVTGLVLQNLLYEADAYRVNALAEAEVDSARAAYDQTYAYSTTYSTDSLAYGGLITNADEDDTENCQIMAQQEPVAKQRGTSSYANIIDGNTGTWFQSTWQASRATCPQFFQVDLKNHPVSDFKFLYGLRDNSWGVAMMWTDITVYASNDETTAKDESIVTLDQISSLSTWKKIGDYRLDEDFARHNWTGTNRKLYVDVNHLGDKYRFIRFFVNKTFKPYPQADANAGVYNVGAYCVGEFQIYENTYDEANMPYTYEPGLKAVADSLRAQEQLVSEHLVTSSVTQDELDELIRLRKAVEAKTPVKGTLQALYQADSTYVSHFGTSDTYGDVTASEMTAIETALQNAKAVIDKQQPLRAELDEQTNALGEAFAAFKGAQIQFEPNKWYYIVGQDLTRQGSTENNGAAYTGDIDETFTYGNCAYAATDNTSDTSDGLGTDNRNALKWGYYVAGTSEGGSDGVDLYTSNLDPHTMWRFVPVENGEYAIQNRATGRFITGYASAGTPLGLTADSAAYIFENLGSGQYKFRSANVWSTYMQFAGSGLLTPRGNSNEPGSRWAFTLVPVETEDEVVMEYPTENTISIKSLPYAVSNDILALNEGLSEIYGIKGLEVVGSDSTLLLEKKTSIAAGEPFILVCGDYTAYDSTSVATSNLILPAVDEFSFEPKTVNGLTAALDYTTVQKPGLGYFADNVLKSTTEGTGIEGHTGYFDVKNMPLFTTTTEADQRIPLSGSGVDAIKGITTGKDGVVNVYSIDGKLIKKNVNAAKAAKGLSKGIYIVGKKKVSVK